SQFLAQDQIQYAQAQGDIALGLIQVYRALGGGWELRLAEQAAGAGACSAAPQAPPPSKMLPAPASTPPAEEAAGEAGGAAAPQHGDVDAASPPRERAQVP